MKKFALVFMYIMLIFPLCNAMGSKNKQNYTTEQIKENLELLESELHLIKKDGDDSSKIRSMKIFYNMSSVVTKYASINLNSNNIETINNYAEIVLNVASIYKGDWAYGNAIHHGNLVLGRVELFKGNIESAKNFLKLASETKGSPQLDSYGPNMTLARELLLKGEKAAVLEYFDTCLVFWDSKSAVPKIKAWKKAIKAGKEPKFSSHLYY